MKPQQGKPKREPPTDEHLAEVDAMIARMRRGRAQWRDVRWPGGQLMVRLQVLSSTDTQLALAAAIHRFDELEIPVNGITIEELAAEKVTQILARACRDPEKVDPRRADHWLPTFRNADILREVTSVDERAAIWVDYQELRASTDPAVDHELDEDALADIDEALKKNSLPLLASVGSWQLGLYLLRTVYRSTSSPTDRSTSSSESEPSPPTSSTRPSEP